MADAAADTCPSWALELLELIQPSSLMAISSTVHSRKPKTQILI